MHMKPFGKEGSDAGISCFEQQIQLEEGAGKQLFNDEDWREFTCKEAADAAKEQCFVCPWVWLGAGSL